MRNLIEKFTEHLLEIGLNPTEIIPDGKIHRFSTKKEDKSDQAGWYVLYDNGNEFMAGAFGDFRSGISEGWHSKSPESLSPEEKYKIEKHIEEAQAQANAEKLKRAEIGRKKATEYWHSGGPPNDHPYLGHKQVASYGLRGNKSGNLMIPLYDIEEQIHGMQLIDQEGNKKFVPGTVKTGHFFPIYGKKDVLYICEGYATGATIHGITAQTVFCAMDAGNLKFVAEVIRKQYPYKKIVIAADNDTKTDGNPGISKAKEAAKRGICFVAWPEFDPEDQENKETDFNDYFLLYGAEKTKSALENIWAPTPEIHVIDGKLPYTIDQAEQILVLLSNDIYKFGSNIVKPLSVIGENNTSQKLRVIEARSLQEELTRLCKWKKWDSRSKDWMAKDCPRNICEAYLAREGDWKLPALRGVINAPTLRKDGTVLQRDGYDPSSGLLLQLSGYDFPLMSTEQPDKAEALNALEKLLDLFKEFPFVDESSKSVAVAAILTVLIRRFLAATPLFAFSAPTPGTGKSALVDVVSIIATGEASAVSTQGANEEEMEKRLGTALLEGNQIINIDNVERPLRGEILCQMLTQPKVKIRILGKSKSQEMPSIATVFTTGNNLSIQGDLTRRALMCKLDASMERPEERHFKRNIFDYTRAKRGELIQAALTILRAYHAGGMPDQGLVPIGSFEDWSKWIRNPLVWLDMADPTKTKKAIEQSDSRLAKLKNLFGAWHEAFGSDAITLKDAVGKVTGNGRSSEYDLLYEAFYEIAGNKDWIDTRLLGNFINKHKDRC